MASARAATWCVALATLSLACASTIQELIGEMESSEAGMRARNEKTVLAFMSLETTFPDERVRALAAAAGRGELAEVDRLVETPLFRAIGSTQAAIELLLDAGADINATTTEGNTATMEAAGLGRFEMVYLLLSKGADYTVTNKNGVDLADRIARRRRLMDPSQQPSKPMQQVIAWLEERGVRVE